MKYNSLNPVIFEVYSFSYPVLGKDIIEFLVQFSNSFVQIKSTGAHLFIEEKNQALPKRAKNNDILAYTGPDLEFENLENSTVVRVILRLEQNIFSDKDSGTFSSSLSSNLRLEVNPTLQSYMCDCVCVH